MLHPLQEFRDTQANVEALLTPHEGAVGYATDLNRLGSYDGAAWNWALYDTIPDNVAGALTISGADAIEYMRIDTTDAQPVVVFNNGEVDVDFRIAANGIPNALFVQGSNGYIGQNVLPLTNIHSLAEGTSDAWMGDVYSSLQVYHSVLFLGRRARGTLGVPLVPIADDSLFRLGGRGYHGAGFPLLDNVRIGMYAGEVFSATRQGTYITFETMNIGVAPNLLERVRIAPNGDVGINESAVINAKLHIFGGTNTHQGGIKLFGDNDDGVRLSMYTHDANGLSIIYAWDENDGGGAGYAKLYLGLVSGLGLMVDAANANTGIGIVAPTGKLHVDQNSNTGAIPVLVLDQADIDIVLMKIIGSAAAAGVDYTLVADSDFGTPGALVGWIQIEIQDDGNRIADADYYVPFYAAPS